MKFKTDMFSEEATRRRAKRQNQIWQLEVGILDVPGNPAIAIAVDVHSRLPIAAAVTYRKEGDIVGELDRACQPSGYPEEIQVDHSIALTSSALKEWGAQHNVAIVFRPPCPWSSATIALLEDIHVANGRKRIHARTLDRHLEAFRRRRDPQGGKPIGDV